MLKCPGLRHGGLLFILLNIKDKTKAHHFYTDLPTPNKGKSGDSWKKQNKKNKKTGRFY